jgi:hypothetical protein
MNESLRELQKQLAGRVQQLSKKLDDVTTSEEAEAVIHEMQEFNHRVTLVGQLLFREESTELDELVAKVLKAKAKVDAAIRKIGKLKEALDTISDFLALTDEAIDLAKALAVA